MFYRGHLIRATFESSLTGLWNFGPSLALGSNLRATVKSVSFSVTESELPLHIYKRVYWLLRVKIWSLRQILHTFKGISLSTDTPTYSDSIGTRPKCHCGQTALYCVTKAMHIYYKKGHLGLPESVTIVIACHYSHGHCGQACLYSTSMNFVKKWHICSWFLGANYGAKSSDFHGLNWAN